MNVFSKLLAAAENYRLITSDHEAWSIGAALDTAIAEARATLDGTDLQAKLEVALIDLAIYEARVKELEKTLVRRDMDKQCLSGNGFVAPCKFNGVGDAIREARTTADKIVAERQSRPDLLGEAREHSPVAIEVEINRCDCHPETCCCGDHLLRVNGEVWTTGRYEVCQRLAGRIHALLGDTP